MSRKIKLLILLKNKALPLPFIFKKKLFQNAFAYTVCNALKQALPFCLIPVLTRYLSPEGYGVLAIIQTAISFLVIVLGFNSQGLLLVKFVTIENKNLTNYVSGIFFIITFTSFIALCLACSQKKIIETFLNAHFFWAILIVVATFFESISSILLVLWQAQQVPLRFGLFQIGQSFINVLLSLFLVILIGWGWEGRILGITLSSIVFGIVSVLILNKNNLHFLRFKWPNVKEALLFGAPSVPHSLGAWLNGSIGLFLVNSMIGVGASGLYSVGFQVGMVVSFLATSFNQAWVPFLFEKLAKNNFSDKIKIVKLTYCYFFSMFFLVGSVSAASAWLFPIFLSQEYYDAQKYVFFVSSAFAFQGMYYMVTNYIFFMQKTYLLTFITVPVALINVICSIIFINQNGTIGAAQGLAASSFFSFILTWIISNKIYKMPWLLKNNLK